MTATHLRLVVPRADDDEATSLLLDVTRAITERPEVVLDVLVWLTGPRVEAFAGLAPTVDAGEVDRWAPARALQVVRQHRVAQAVKSPRLRSLLGGLPPVEALWLGGLPAVAVLGWVDAPSTLLLQVGGTDLDEPWAEDARTHEAVRVADVVLVTDVAAADWAEAHGARPERIARHAALSGPDLASPPDTADVGLYGIHPDEVPDLVTAIALAAPATTGFRWLAAPRGAWDLWHGRGGLLAHPITVADPAAPTVALPGLRVLVHATPLPDPLRRLAEVLGVALVPRQAVGDVGPVVRRHLDAGRSAAAGWGITADQAAQDLVLRLTGAR